MIGDEVFLESSLSKKKEVTDKETVSMGIICRHCGAVGDHWTLRCPYKDKLQQQAEEEDESASSSSSSAAPLSSSSRPDRYVPPSMRNRQESGGKEMGDGRDRGARGARGGQNDENTIRVTNLSEDATQDDLEELFSPFGSLQRVYVAKDSRTQATKGFLLSFFHFFSFSFFFLHFSLFF